MTREEAKAELRPLKGMKHNIKPIELEIERLMTKATKMTAGYDIVNSSGSHRNKIEEAIIKLERYWNRLSAIVMRDIDYKERCLDKVEQIKSRTLREILVYYFFMDYTLEETAERIGKSYQWTYELYKSALDEYAKVSEENSFT
jgi:hypothetical protein